MMFNKKRNPRLRSFTYQKWHYFEGWKSENVLLSSGPYKIIPSETKKPALPAQMVSA